MHYFSVCTYVCYYVMLMLAQICFFKSIVTLTIKKITIKRHATQVVGYIVHTSNFTHCESCIFFSNLNKEKIFDYRYELRQC